MNKTTFNAKDIAIAALLTALAILIPMVMPFKIVLEPIFSATFASHVPGILAMFVGPFAVIGTAIGSAVGFIFCGLGPGWQPGHFCTLVFGLIGYQLIKKKYNIFLVVLDPLDSRCCKRNACRTDIITVCCNACTRRPVLHCGVHWLRNIYSSLH